MSEMSPAQELLADLGTRIAEEEAKVMKKIDRLSQYETDAQYEIQQAWDKFQMQVEPMRRQQEYILKKLAQIEACKPPVPVVVAVEEADRMGLPRIP
jgi:uncharacterized protein YhaN